MNQENIKQNLAEWNDEMVKKYHAKGTPSESKNFLRRFIEKLRLKKIIWAARLRKDDIVLDLGCGEGFLISLMPADVKRIVGVDISRTALERAGKEVLKERKNVTLQWGNAEDLNFDKEFDKIICSEMLEHVPHPKKVMAEICESLKDDGVLIISVPDEKRIQCVMKIAKMFFIDKLLGAYREDKEYEWHLQKSDRQFIAEIAEGLFDIKKISRTPPFIGYQFVAVLTKKRQ